MQLKRNCWYVKIRNETKICYVRETKYQMCIGCYLSCEKEKEKTVYSYLLVFA